MKRGFDRTQRIADLIQKSLAQIILLEMANEGLPLVTITGVSVSRDIGQAKIFVSVLAEEEQIKNTIAILNEASKSLRYSLAQAVKLRTVPALKFIYDSSTAHGFHISSLIDKAMVNKKK